MPSVRSASAGRPSISTRSTTPTPNLMPPSRVSVKAPSAIPPLDPPTRNRDKRLLLFHFSTSLSIGVKLTSIFSIPRGKI